MPGFTTRPTICPPPRARVGRWSTFGPHAIGTQRFAAVSSRTSFAQVVGAILGKQALAQNPDRMRSPL
jgi:hypothetical protein